MKTLVIRSSFFIFTPSKSKSNLCEYELDRTLFEICQL